MNRRAQVRVPASTTNLGAGFDCVGAAVDLHLAITAGIDASAWSPVVTRAGTLADLDVAPADDRIVLGARAACESVGREAPAGFRVHATSTIPVARGLGSSAAATVAGVVAANALLGLGLSDADVVRIAAQVEGHPDNAAAAVFGGATLVVAAGDRPRVAPLAVHDSLALVLAIPGFRVETSEARRLLPAHVRHRVAARSAALSAALVQGLASADADLIAAALEDDVLHVPYRRALIRGYDAVLGAARAAGALGTTISGSGSTLVSVAPRTSADAVATAMHAAWREAGVDAATLVNPPRVEGYTVAVRTLCADAGDRVDGDQPSALSARLSTVN